MSRVTLSINDELLTRIDSYAKTNYMNRSSVISFATNQFLIAHEMQSLMVEMKRAMQKIAENGMVDESQKEQMDKFLVMCELFQEGAAE